MTPITEEEVRAAAKYMGYDLSTVPNGYRLTRDHDREREIIIATSLELIADFLKH
jgi:hypothetical protein